MHLKRKWIKKNKITPRYLFYPQRNNVNELSCKVVAFAHLVVVAVVSLLFIACSLVAQFFSLLTSCLHIINDFSRNLEKLKKNIYSVNYDGRM